MPDLRTPFGESVTVVRLSRDGRRAIVRLDSSAYATLDLVSRKGTELSSLQEALAEGSWRMASSEDEALVASALSEDGGAFVFDPYAKYDFADANVAFYALGPDEEIYDVDSLIAVDHDAQMLYEWTEDGFRQADGILVEDFEYPLILPIDGETAEWLARRLDESPYELHSVADVDPDERNLAELAFADLDVAALERVSSIIADASGYTPAERSLNARRQVRGFNGRFGGGQVKQTSELKAFRKGKLADKLPLILFPGKMINEWIAAQAPITAGAAGDSQSIAQPSPDPVPKAQTGNDKMTEFVGEQPETEQEKASETTDALYFAIVDAADSTAVLEVISITRNDSNEPEAWRRVKGEWKSDPQTLADLTGATPPPVVHLADPELVKVVLGQVDHSDLNPDEFPTDAVNEDAPAPVAASGAVALSVDTVQDLALSIHMLGLVAEEDLDSAKDFLRSGARRLGRLHLIPEEWRAKPVVETPLIASLYGEYGEVLTADASMGGLGGAQRLKAYWTTGKGALKIRWGTPGDLTRAHRHLAKYVGPGLAWGLAQEYHKSIFGVPNIVHDRATGQHRPRRGM